MIDFPYYDNPPEGYDYWFENHTKTITKIWIRNKRRFVYADNQTASSVWGFYDARKGTFLSPINAKKPGKPVNIEDTTPYTAMQLNLNPLEKALFGS